jgi:hypothetical protein
MCPEQVRTALGSAGAPLTDLPRQSENTMSFRRCRVDDGATGKSVCPRRRVSVSADHKEKVTLDEV